MTLYGPSQTEDIRRVFEIVEGVGRKYNLVPFKMSGFDWNDGNGGKVIACHINPSDMLKSLQRELSEELSKI